jgi:hypothetical protein
MSIHNKPDGGGVRRPTPTVRRTPRPIPASRRRTNPNERNQWSIDAISSAMDKASAPKAYGGWVDDHFAGLAPPPGSPSPASPGGGPGGGRGRGGGMRGGGNSNFNAFASRIQELAGSMRARPDTLSPRINQAVDADLAAARAAYGSVADRSADPYAELEFRASRFDPGISGMVGAQGGDVNAATAAQMAGQSDIDYMNQLFGNQARQMSAVQQSSNQAWNADKGRDAANVESHIGAQRAAMLAAAQQRQEDREEAARRERTALMLQLLQQGYGAGADLSKINFGGLL